MANNAMTSTTLWTDPRQHGCRISVLSSRGHELVVLENELVAWRVLASKGADVVEIRHKPSDMNLLWQGRTELLPAGAYVETVGRAQGSFLDHFVGGWQELFPNGGFATTYQGANLGQHGEVSVLPWHADVRRDDADCVAVRFWTNTIRMPFRIAKTITLRTGSTAADVAWEIVNLGAVDVHFSWGQHPGFGAPFLSRDCVIDVPAGELCTPHEAQFPGHRLRPGQRTQWPIGEGLDGGEVRADLVGDVADRAHDVLWVQGLEEGRAAIRNPSAQLGLCMTWDLAVFPYLWIWQVYGGMIDYPSWGTLYHVAIEPFTGPFGSLTDNIDGGTAPILHAGELLETGMTVDVLAGERALHPMGERS